MYVMLLNSQRYWKGYQPIRKPTDLLGFEHIALYYYIFIIIIYFQSLLAEKIQLPLGRADTVREEPNF